MSRRSLPLLIVALVFSFPCFAQDASTGAIRITVEDPAGSRIAGAAITVTHTTTGVHRGFLSDPDGVFTVQLLPPGEYAVRVEAAGMSPQVTSGVLVQLGGLTEIAARLTLAGVAETVMVAAPAGMVETQSSAVSSVVEEQEITDLPLNGRRFADLALLLPGVAQDPRGLTSASNGDLAFGGVRGWQSSYLVDGADNNNAFFAQARGRYRAPYQFSNEVVQKFRVSSNTYGAELGRAGGAVINVVTKSGSNQFHGTAFYYLRDSSFNARHPFVDFKPADRQHQLGGTFGGPLKKDRAFFLAGFDQHIFHVPTVVRFLTGYTQLVPNVGDFELSDYSLVLAAARSLSSMGGSIPLRAFRQCRVSQARLHSHAASSVLGAPEYFALLRREQRLLRSGQPGHHLCHQRERRGGCGHRKWRGLAHQRSELAPHQPSAGAVLARPPGVHGQRFIPASAHP